MENLAHNEEPFPALSPEQEEEFRKLQVLIGQGGNVFERINKDLSVEIEGQFSDYIDDFERAFKNRKSISVYDKIGRPEFVEACYLNDEEIVAAFERIVGVLEKHNIILDVICDYEDRERLLYTFITEELFLEETDDTNVRGMMTHFIYEEFHENHLYELEETSRCFLKSFFDKGSNYYELYVKNDFENPMELSAFRGAFASFSLHRLEFTEMFFDTEEAMAGFMIDFSGVLKKSSAILSFSGEGTIIFDYKYGYWYVKNVDLPMDML